MTHTLQCGWSSGPKNWGPPKIIVHTDNGDFEDVAQPVDTSYSWRFDVPVPGATLITGYEIFIDEFRGSLSKSGKGYEPEEGRFSFTIPETSIRIIR